MKKLILLLVALIVFGGTAMSQSKVAHVNTQVLWDTLPSAKVALKKYSNAEKEAYDELQVLNLQLQTAFEKYQSEQNGMNQAVRESEEKKLMQMQERIESTSQSLKDYLMQVSNELNTPLQDRIKRAVDIVAARKRLSYVFDESAAIYSGGGENITNEVIDQLLILDSIEQED